MSTQFTSSTRFKVCDIVRSINSDWPVPNQRLDAIFGEVQS